MTPRRGPFLSAEWRHIVVLSYAIDPSVLARFVPGGTELDVWNDDESLISVVGLQFRDTRLLGVPVLFHRHFEEVNLRFYVRRTTAGEVRRGVVFIKEIVPRRAIAWVAREVYNENYVALPMSHIDTVGSGNDPRVTYRWCFRDRSERLSARLRGEPIVPPPASRSEFITEHYWGYSRQRDGSTLEYRVEHPRWEVWKVDDAELVCDVRELYGGAFAEPLSGDPVSALVARGSKVVVRRGTAISS